MYGAILGDIIGSPFEFDRGKKTKDFELFSKESKFTDDTVMTVAVAEALLSVGADASVAEIKEACIDSMKDWGRKYPNCGFGERFVSWVLGDDRKPYNSYGNGSAMRVSPAGWLYDTIERTREVARATAEVTHNHPEGIKGAEATAAVIYMARNGASPEEIKKYVEAEFEYDLDRTLDEIRPTYHHVEDCMRTVPEAIISLLEGVDFEDTIRNAVSLGGDTDTLGAIAGAMAEAMYGVYIGDVTEAASRIPDEMREVTARFAERVGYKTWKECADEELDQAIQIDAELIDKPMPESFLNQLADTYRKLIRLGNEVAMNNLGSLYYTGRIGEVGYESAVKYYKMAAEKLYPLALVNLGCCYYYGYGTEQNYELAFKTLSEAALLEDDEAIFRLGDMHRRGQYVQQSDVMAGRLYKKAYATKPLDCRRGNNDGYKAARVGDVFYYGLDEDVNYTAAMHFYQEAELGLYEQIKSGEIYLKKLLDEVIEKQGIIREKMMGEVCGR